MREGLYKVEFRTLHGSGRGVIDARRGRLLGGNSAFAFIGRYDEHGSRIVVEVSTRRHNPDPAFRPLFGTDEITLNLTGRAVAEGYGFEGGTAQLPGIAFAAMLTPISDDALPPAAMPKAGGLREGLYSIHIRMLDGVDGGNTGVMVLERGRIHGGDAFFDYIGSYNSANGRWKGEIVNHEHTPSKGERPVFGGYEVGIGFSGSFTDEGAEAEATALAGKRSLRFHAGLKLIETI